jgi:membrane protease YdiL (CAAX protease family)
MEWNFAPLLNIASLAIVVGSLFVWLAVFRRVLARTPPIAPEPRNPVPWLGGDVALIMLGALFCDQLALASLQAIIGEFQPGMSPLSLLASSVGRLGALLLAVPYLILKTDARASDLGVNRQKISEDLRLGGMLFLAAVLPVFGVQWFFTQIIDIPSEHPLIKLTQDSSNVPVLLMATFVAVIVAPLFEEFVFRVVLQGWLETQQLKQRERRGLEPGTPGWTPTVVVSLLFAGLHAGHGPDPIAIFLLSLFLGYGYRQTHRILPSLTLHFCINGMTVLNLWTLYFTRA